jgi:tetratricopeptide (TPR) repeat protein
LAGRTSSMVMAVFTGTVATWSRDYEAGITALRNQADDPSNPGLRTLMLADLCRMAGQERESRAYADSARMEFEWAIERLPTDSLDPFAQRARFLAGRGQALAYLGRSAEAVRDAGRAMAMMPVSRDPLEATNVLESATAAYIVAGDHDAAFRTLDQLASIPSDLSAASLRLHPLYDSLRDDPRYPALLAKVEAAERTGTGTR